MSLVRGVLEKYKAHGGLTDTTDTSPSVSSVSDSPIGIQGGKGTSVSSVSESGKGFSDKYSTENKPQKPPGDVLTQLTQGSDQPKAEERRQQLHQMMAEGDQSKKYCWLTDTECDPEYVILALAIRDVATCELKIPREKYDPFLLMETLGKEH